MEENELAKRFEPVGAPGWVPVAQGFYFFPAIRNLYPTAPHWQSFNAIELPLPSSCCFCRGVRDCMKMLMGKSLNLF